jgi:hypothetical protein
MEKYVCKVAMVKYDPLKEKDVKKKFIIRIDAETLVEAYEKAKSSVTDFCNSRNERSRFTLKSVEVLSGEILRPKKARG